MNKLNSFHYENNPKEGVVPYKIKRVCVDMTLSSLHHGHIRLLRKASDLGSVIVALTRDNEVYRIKGFRPLLCFEERKEILLAIRYVDDVIESNWTVDERFLDQHNLDILVHGDDNSNPVPDNRLIIFPRTPSISSSMMREGLN